MVKLVYRTDEIKNVRDIFDKEHYISMFYHFGLYLVGKKDFLVCPKVNI